MGRANSLSQILRVSATSPFAETNINNCQVKGDIFMGWRLPTPCPFANTRFVEKNFESSLPGFAHLYSPSAGHSLRSTSLCTCLIVTLQFFGGTSVPFPSLENVREQGPWVSFLLYSKMQSQSLEPLRCTHGGYFRPENTLS